MVVIDENVDFSAIAKLPNPVKPSCPTHGLELNVSSYNRFGQHLQIKKLVCPSHECRTEQQYCFEDWLAFINYYNPDAKGEFGTFSKNLFDLKYNLERPLLSEIEKFAQAFLSTIDKRIGRENIDFCVSIPSSAGIPPIALESVLHFLEKDLKYFPEMIEQTRQKSSQKSMVGYSERRANVKGAYRLKDPESARGSRILLLDDIVTTGASMNEVSRIVATESEVYVFAGCLGKTRRV